MSTDAKDLKDTKNLKELFNIIDAYIGTGNSTDHLENLRKRLQQDINTRLEEPQPEQKETKESKEKNENRMLAPTLLCYYAERNLAAVNILLKHGANPNVEYTVSRGGPPSYNTTPLMTSISSRNTAITLALINAGADVTRRATVTIHGAMNTGTYEDITVPMCFYLSQQKNLRDNKFGEDELLTLNLLLSRDIDLTLRATAILPVRQSTEMPQSSGMPQPQTLLDFIYLGPNEGFPKDPLSNAIVQKVYELLVADKKVLEESALFGKEKAYSTLEDKDAQKYFLKHFLKRGAELVEIAKAKKAQEALPGQVSTLQAKVTQLEHEKKQLADTVAKFQEQLNAQQKENEARHQSLQAEMRQFMETMRAQSASRVASAMPSGSSEMLTRFDVERKERLSQAEAPQPAAASQQSQQQSAATTSTEAPNKPSNPTAG